MRRARYSANFLAASEMEEERTRVGRTEEAKALQERYGLTGPEKPQPS
jgi:hypothetical protein